MEDNNLADLLQNTILGIRAESARLRDALEENEKLEAQIQARLDRMGISANEGTKQKPRAKSPRAPKGAAVVFGTESHASKAMRVICSHGSKGGVTTDDIATESGIVSDDTKKTVWNTVWRLCDEGYAKRVGEKNERVIPTPKGLITWQASPLSGPK